MAGGMVVARLRARRQLRFIASACFCYRGLVGVVTILN
jgi:hypothetical protein